MRHYLSGILTSLAIFAFMAGPAIAVPFSVDILTDFYPTETSFDLTMDSGGTSIDSQGPFASRYTSYVFDYDLAPGDYEFAIYDSYGDGLSVGGGGYTLALDGVEIAAGRYFAAVEVVAFSIAGSAGSAPAGPDPSGHTPEPSAALLFGAGALLVGTALRRRRSRS